MTPRYIAKFKYGRATLTRVFAQKETERTIVRSHSVNIIGSMYLPTVIRKSEYDIFPDVQLALAFLITKAELYREEMEKALTQAHKQVSDLMELSRKLKEEAPNDNP